MMFLFSKGSLFVLTSLCTQMYLKSLFFKSIHDSWPLVWVTLVQAFVSETLAQYQNHDILSAELPIVQSASCLIIVHTLRSFWFANSLRFYLGLSGFVMQSFYPTSIIHWLSQMIWLAFADDSLWSD